jgi:hypothetical protein
MDTVKQCLRLLAWASLSWIVAGCGRNATLVDPLPAGGRHLLFVGNSLTYTNDLPATVAAIAASAGDTFRVASATGPNLALIDHLEGATNATAAIRAGGWDYVILQQGPTPAGICRDSLVLWTTMFDAEIRAAHAQPAILMTWPASNQQAGFDDVRVSFQEAASSVHGIFLPAGEAWRAAWEADPTLALYGPDGFHPSPTGTFLTALEIYERLSGRDARELPAQAFASGRTFSLPEPTIHVLHEAAHTANTRFSASPLPLESRSANPSVQRSIAAGRAQC